MEDSAELQRFLAVGLGYPQTSGSWVARHNDRFTHAPPAAGAIAWVGYRGKRKSAELAEDLREHKGVLLAPGEQFGMESYLRVGFGGPAGHLRKGLARVDKLLSEEAGRGVASA